MAVVEVLRLRGSGAHRASLLGAIYHGVAAARCRAE